jgi:gamma-glutamylcyclotransferase (GGCT)/AIG2-like uncharacterized protein YtfP/lysophospholipase L1-like esterase
MVNIFFYGTLKRGGCRSHVLRGQRFAGEAKTVAKYRMYNTGSYPALVEDEDGLEVEGEVWEVDDECLQVVDAIEAVPDLYERKPVSLTGPGMDGVETYIYRRSVDGLPDCGGRWEHHHNSTEQRGSMGVVYLADLNRSFFDQDRLAVDVVCAGDSLTGWNNFGPPYLWPYRTYPHFLQHLWEPSGLRIADGGIAGELSENGLGHVERYLDVFPNSRYFIIGFGTNDLGTWPDLESTSRRIIENLGMIVQAVRAEGKQPVLLNVPYAHEGMFPSHIARDTHEKRNYHNDRLGEFCLENSIPLADICSHLRDDCLGDELHPNEAGAKIIAEQVFGVLASIRPAKSTTVRPDILLLSGMTTEGQR